MDSLTLIILASLLVASTVAGLVWRSRQGAIDSGGSVDISPALLVPGSWLTLGRHSCGEDDVGVAR